MKKIILFSIIFVGLLSFLNYKNSPKPVAQLSPITPSPIPTQAPWQTYRNEKYGFEFQYPSNWTIVDVDGHVDQDPKTPTTAPMLAKTMVMTYSGDPNKINENKSQQLVVNVIDNPKKLSLEKYFIDQRWSKEWLDLMEKISINNLESIKLKGFDGTSDTYYINQGKYIIYLGFSYTEYEDKFKIPPRQTFDRILSTFNLFSITSTHKTYFNKEYGFEFQYPAKLTAHIRDNQQGIDLKLGDQNILTFLFGEARIARLGYEQNHSENFKALSSLKVGNKTYPVTNDIFGEGHPSGYGECVSEFMSVDYLADIDSKILISIPQVEDKTCNPDGTKKIVKSFSPTNINLAKQVLSTFKFIDSASQNLPNTSTWKTYTNTNDDLNFTIKLPPGWFFKKEEMVDGQATVWFSKVSKNKTLSTSHDLEITIGSPIVYSTSGGVCANQWCEDEGSFPVQIDNSTYTADVTRASRGEPKKFENFRFRIDNIGKSFLAIRGTFFTDQEKEEIAQILSTFKFTD